MTRLDVNGKAVSLEVPADTPLLWVLRDELGLTSTKFGYGMALCGACTVHLDGTPTRACVTPIDMAVDCGFAVYPDRIRSQMEGAAVMALSSALYREITFRDGRAQQATSTIFRWRV
jgi:isoquinoline 1-oxidoreductase alpha subunit